MEYNALLKITQILIHTYSLASPTHSQISCAPALVPVLINEPKIANSRQAKGTSNKKKVVN